MSKFMFSRLAFEKGLEFRELYRNGKIMTQLPDIPEAYAF